MLADAGLNDKEKSTNNILQTENHMEALVKIIKKEQTIYDLVMHELIRQVTVECVERGELLSRLRGKYADLISKIPNHINSIYTQSLALHAMEKRLGSKLVTFKTRIESLTGELSDVQQKEREATGETIRARRDLDDAVREARRSADLLHEYQALYEMQRLRLEKQVIQITNERDVWTQVAYSLALKVIDENSLTNCKKIQVSQTAWTQLARYFINSLLSENDSKDFNYITDCVVDFTTEARIIANDIISSDTESFTGFSQALEMFKLSLKRLETTTVIVEENPGHGTLKTVHCPEDGGKSFFQELISQAKPIENMLEVEIEKRSGEQFVMYTEKLHKLEEKREKFSIIANLVFQRHDNAFSNGDEESATTTFDIKLNSLNNEFHRMTEWYLARVNGENGISDRLATLQSALEKLLRRSVNTRLSDIEWLHFHNDLNGWIETFEKVVDILDYSLKIDKRTEKDKTASLKVGELQTGLLGFVVSLNQWVEHSKVATKTNVASMTSRIDTMNTELMRWLSDYLVECAPKQSSGTPELEPGCPPKTSVFVTTGLARSPGIANLLSVAHAISISVTDLTDGIRASVKP